MRRRCSALAALVALVVPSLAQAIEVPNVGGETMLIDITNTSVLSYRFNNRNDIFGRTATRVDDFYGEWLDRLNLQLSWWRLRAGVRGDTSVYFHTPTNADIARWVQEDYGTSSGAQQTDYQNQFLRELSNRFRTSFYPAKLYVGYAQRGLDVTLGDFYAQLGQGLVFSTRKVDELAVDTTVRGAKVVFDHDFGSWKLGGTFFAGQMNPLRVDEASGRQLSGSGSPLFFGFPRGRDITLTQFEASGAPVTVIEKARPSYLEDTVFGAHLEGGNRFFTLGANASVVLRQDNTVDYLRCLAAGLDKETSPGQEIRGLCASQFPTFGSSDPALNHRLLVTYSGSIAAPNIAKMASLYMEVAGQSLTSGRVGTLDGSGNPADRVADLSGYAIYGSANIHGGPVSATLEMKHYRSFFPLTANVDAVTPGFRAAEYGLVKYNQVPTAEPIYPDAAAGGAPNVCITGGRARVDYRFRRGVTAYLWLGRYVSWSEIPRPNFECDTSPERRTDTWDSAAGVDLAFEQDKTRARTWVGVRSTDLAVPQLSNAGMTDTFYREGYVRYDLVKHLGGSFSLQMQGFHRHRYEPGFSASAWTEGENYTALHWSPHLSAVLGYEYQAQEGCQPATPPTAENPEGTPKNLCHFVNGGLTWRSQASGEGYGAKGVLGRIFDTVSVFVGQRRGAIRCVSGVCRRFPPFEGAKIEITSRF